MSGIKEQETRRITTDCSGDTREHDIGQSRRFTDGQEGLSD